MPCHVLSCSCGRFTGESQSFLCPVSACAREYATRASLEIHLYGQHPGLTARERSVLLQSAVQLSELTPIEAPGPAVVETRPPPREEPVAT
jgi:hypothetical protein